MESVCSRVLRMMFGKALPSEQFFYTCRSRVGSKRFQTSPGSRSTDVVSSRKRPVVPRADDWSFGFHRSLARCGEAFHSAPRKMFLGSTRKCLTGPRYPTFVTSEYGNSLEPSSCSAQFTRRYACSKSTCEGCRLCFSRRDQRRKLAAGTPHCIARRLEQHCGAVRFAVPRS